MSKHGFGRGQKDASRSGYLQKKGPLGVWQKRWFILEKGEVRYYRTHQQAADDLVGSDVQGCCGRVKSHASKTRNVGFSGNKPKEVMGVEDKATHGLYGDEDSNIDFEMGGMQLRASSVEEKKAWLAVLSNASMVRSFSSKNLEDLMGPADVELGTLRLADLHMGEVLGSGTTGTVKLAVHIPTGHRVAVKIIAKRKFFLNKKMEGNIQRELRLLDEISQMDHPNIVKTYGHIDDPAYIYIVMECCEGGELLEMLETAGNYTEADCCEVIEQSCAVLQYLHSKGIVHRDIKPENMLLSDKEDVTSIKLADFGLANVIEDKGTLSTVCGSPAYMAPEVHKMGNYDGQVDMYSLGIMMYLMLSGVLPFHASDDMNKRMEDEDFDFDSFDDSVSAEARDVISRLLRSDPEKRATAEEVLEHRWIVNKGQWTSCLADVQKKIALFNAKGKWRAGINTIIATNRFKTVMKSFSAVRAFQDAGGDGVPGSDDSQNGEHPMLTSTVGKSLLDQHKAAAGSEVKSGMKKATAKLDGDIDSATGLRFINPIASADDEVEDEEPAPAPEPIDKRVDHEEEPMAAFERITAIALEAEHPAIDEGGIETMLGYIESGRFSAEHYIKMWTTRLEGMTPSILV